MRDRDTRRVFYTTGNVEDVFKSRRKSEKTWEKMSQLFRLEKNKRSEPECKSKIHLGRKDASDKGRAPPSLSTTSTSALFKSHRIED
ncbi:hypothetical protein KQX54_003559 [Cotesia glomerata]|uniref:Uncharacterized protein n=1 Tax=Cotesia glomerata TaxID=32391 RepID=A0AAV7ILL3_COTGL|nr:hypothetical protein KQX54_003559 [Cotesia glomerata]